MKTLSKEQLEEIQNDPKEDFVLINVLPQKYFNEHHINKSINIPHENDGFVETVQKTAGTKERKIVVYCASFDCQASPKAGKKLEDAGFTNIFDYEGGVKDWFGMED